MENIALRSPKYEHVSITRHHARILCRTATVQLKHDIIKCSVKECAYIRGVPENHIVLTC